MLKETQLYHYQQKVVDKLSENQKQTISDLITRKQLVFVINDEKEAMEILERYK